MEYDNGRYRRQYKMILKRHLAEHYGPFDDNELKYKKEKTW